MENIITGTYLDHFTEGQIVVDDAGLESAYTTCDRNGEQVSQPVLLPSPGGEEVGIAPSEHIPRSTPTPNSVSGQEEHINTPTTLLPAQGKPRNRQKYSIGACFVGRFHGRDVHDVSQHDEGPDIGRSGFPRSRALQPTAEPTLVKQGKKQILSPYPENTTPLGSYGPKNGNQYPPGMYYDASFPDPGTDDVPQYDSHTTLGNEHGDLVHFNPPLSSPVSEQREEIIDIHTPNIVIFGETGVGKSSIINLIADQKLAGTSNDALGCTFQHQQYHITLGGMSCTLWDTAGLDEGTEGTVPAKIAERNLKELMRGLTRSGGIHLIIYCIRGARLTRALKRNYDLFYVTVCRRKVSVALVVTGLEHQLGEMETWWATNEMVLRRHGMQFDAHACVTTLNVEDPIIQRRRSDSQMRLRELVVEYCGCSGWKTDLSFMSWVLPLVRGFLHGPSSTDRLGSTSIIRKVTVCGSFSEPLPGVTAVWNKSTEQLGNRQYEFVRVDKQTLDTFSRRMLDNVGGIGAGVLVFHTSPLVDHRIPSKDFDALKKFYDIAGGQLCPVIIVLQGCDDTEVTWASWNQFASRHSDIQIYLVSLPDTLGDARAKLDEMIECLYVEHAEDKGPSLLKRFMAALC